MTETAPRSHEPVNDVDIKPDMKTAPIGAPARRRNLMSPMILDLGWAETPIHKLTLDHVINVLGRELKVVHTHPATRGGDFYHLEAVGLETCAHVSPADCTPVCLAIVGAVVMEADKNTLVQARVDRDLP